MIDFTLYDSMEMLDVLVAKFEEGTADEHGNIIDLVDGDERLVILQCMNYLMECAMNEINKRANNNLAVYADEASLIYLGIQRNIYRIQPKPATTSMRFYASAEAPADVTVEKGAKVTADGVVFFAIDEEITISPGGYADVTATSTSSGADTNGYSVGAINVLVNTTPYIDSVTNTEPSEGGGDIEDLEAFRKRVIFAPLRYTVAGTKDAYKQKTMEVSAQIDSVVVTSTGADVFIYILCKGGELPSQALLDVVLEYLSQDDKKMVVDNLHILPAQRVEYNVNLTYKVAKNDRMQESAIKEAVENAINDYITAAGTHMGEPINPEMLKKACYMAGAASVEVISPVYKELEEYEVQSCTGATVNYGGLL